MEKKFIKAIQAIYHFFDRANEGLARIAAACIVICAVLTVLEIIMRYLGHPTIWSYWLVIWFQMGLICFGVAYTQKYRGHVNVDILVHSLSVKKQVICRIIAYSVCLILSGIFLWQAIIFAGNSIRTWEHSSGEFYVLIWPIKLMFVIMGFFLFVVFLRQLIGDIVWLKTKQGMPEGIKAPEGKE